MNNIELEQQVKELLRTTNYFDYAEKLIAFEKEYKQSDFYKHTKKPLKEVIAESRIHYLFNLDGIGARIQEVIDSLTLEKLEDIMNKAAEMFEKENSDILGAAKIYSELK